MTKPAFLKCVLASVLIHGFSALTALAGLAVVHRLSDKAIWGVFSSSYRVRELSLYFFNVIPLYVLAFLLLAVAERGLFKSRALSFWRLLTLGLLAVPLSMALHAPLFPWSAQSAAMLTLFAAFYVSAYAALCGVGTMVSEEIKSFPAAPSIRRPLILFLSVGVIFAGGLRLASEAGIIDQQETLKPGPWPSPPEYVFKPSPATGALSSDTAIRPPRIDLLTIEELPESTLDGLRWNFLNVLDINGDGFMDVVFQDRQKRIAIAVNRGGKLTYDEKLSRDIESGPVADFAFADLDGDGWLDLVASRPTVLSRLKGDAFYNIFWNFLNPEGGGGFIKRGRAAGPWEDVTESLFPDGPPRVILKSEPVFFFDANGDGLLDILWSGYPRPWERMNRLYIQRPDGTFADELDRRLDQLPEEIYPEGSDVADIDGDGDIDFFGYGYLYLNEGGRYRQVCGAEMRRGNAGILL